MTNNTSNNLTQILIGGLNVYRVFLIAKYAGSALSVRDFMAMSNWPDDLLVRPR